MIDVDGNLHALEKYLAERDEHEERAELLQAAIDDAKEAEAFSEELENMLNVAIVALNKIAACDEGNVVKYIQTVDALALDALDALKGKLDALKGDLA
jgi:NifB/MoaA-like Fe-S oxidoreductase